MLRSHRRSYVRLRGFYVGWEAEAETSFADGKKGGVVVLWERNSGIIFAFFWMCDFVDKIFRIAVIFPSKKEVSRDIHLEMPPVKNEGESDADGDMSGAESDHSASSRAPDHDSSAEEADEPDSDDSSEMSESECERRRSDCLDNLSKL